MQPQITPDFPIQNQPATDPPRLSYKPLKGGLYLAQISQGNGIVPLIQDGEVVKLTQNQTKKFRLAFNRRLNPPRPDKVMFGDRERTPILSELLALPHSAKRMDENGKVACPNCGESNQFQAAGKNKCTDCWQYFYARPYHGARKVVKKIYRANLWYDGDFRCQNDSCGGWNFLGYQYEGRHRVPETKTRCQHCGEEHIVSRN